MPNPSEDPRGRIRRIVGMRKPRSPLETVWRLRNELKRLGIPFTSSDDNVRRDVGHSGKEKG